MKSSMITKPMKSFCPCLGPVHSVILFYERLSSVILLIHSFIHPSNSHWSTKHERQRLTNLCLLPQRSSILADCTHWLHRGQTIAHLKWLYSCRPSCLSSEVLLNSYPHFFFFVYVFLSPKGHWHTVNNGSVSDLGVPCNESSPTGLGISLLWYHPWGNTSKTS